MIKKVMLLGSGELGKELAISLARLGIKVVACDRYENAPAMQVTPYSRVFNMLDAKALAEAVQQEEPDLIIPEVEAIATGELVALESRGYRVVPSAFAVHATMNRRAIRNLAAEELGLPTAKFRYAATYDQLQEAAKVIGMPCFIKPLMSSSGKGQSRVKHPDEFWHAWQTSQTAGRTGPSEVIVEQGIDFDEEITVLTVSSVNGIQCLPAIGHRQEKGDYVESWMPHPLKPEQWQQAQDIAKKVVKRLGGYGLFGVELFVVNNPKEGGPSVIFSEVSPRPHDTGMVTLLLDEYSEFSLHARAILGHPVHLPPHIPPIASAAFKSPCDADPPLIDGLKAALSEPGVEIRVFGKPQAHLGRRMAVVCARGESIGAARSKACKARDQLQVRGQASP
jgi:phosphoribosylglycinamide formyltransferase 2